MPGNRLGDVGAAIEAVANEHGYGIVRPFVGHGIGQAMHEDPQVPNYGRPGTGLRIESGMCFAIEPMFNLGGDEVALLDDGWTVVTADGGLSAHFENTIAVTDGGPRSSPSHEARTSWRKKATYAAAKQPTVSATRMTICGHTTSRLCCSESWVGTCWLSWMSCARPCTVTLVALGVRSAVVAWPYNVPGLMALSCCSSCAWETWSATHPSHRSGRKSLPRVARAGPEEAQREPHAEGHKRGRRRAPEENGAERGECQPDGHVDNGHHEPHRQAPTSATDGAMPL